MRIALLLLCLLLPATSHAQESFEQMIRHFDYDKAAPLVLKQLKAQQQNGFTVQDITYASPMGGEVPAYLIIPEGKGPFAGIIWGHWAMRASPVRNRNEFLDEAKVLARVGVISLLIDSSFVRPGVIQDEDILSKRNADQLQQQVIDLRRGIDLLLARPDVDPKRIAYVGHSYNASTGAMLAGIDKRLKALVLMAGAFSDAEFLTATDPEMVKWRADVGEAKVKEYLVRYGWLDPGNYIGRMAPAAVLLQFARNDGLLTEKRERNYFAMASEPKTLKLYDATHALNAEARWDRVEWLRAQLGLRSVPKAAVAAIPETK